MRGLIIVNSKFLPRILIALLTVTLSGCTLHKSTIKDAQLIIPPSYTTEAQKAADLSGRWWEKFEDETLNKLIEKYPSMHRQEPPL